LDFVVRLLRSGYAVRHERKYLAAFTMTGKNISTDKRSIREDRLIQQRFAGFPPLWARVINLGRLAYKFVSGAYFYQKPLRYAIYTGDQEKQRKEFCVRRASFRWRPE
jgi:hypothetical protein